MSISRENIVGELVADNYRYAGVFKKAGIDFCCNGNRSIETACEAKKIDTDDLIKKLEQAANEFQAGTTDFKTWPLDLLADYVEKRHHRYVEQKVQEITPFLTKVARVHGDRHPELLEVQELFLQSAEELTQHMKKEEMILFPFIRDMVQSESSGNLSFAPFGSVQNPIQMMMHEHDTEGERFRRIAELTNDYTPPADGCNTYRVTFSLLQEFEEDLHMHIHLENNILFPKSIELEQSLATS
ncbi:MAG: iron-sulfur cluster repair di-iron protein [Moheibacter sp.]